MDVQSLPSLAENILDALSVNLALLDNNGRILYTNSQWTRFGRENGQGSNYSSVGENYLDLCDETDDRYAKQSAKGIRELIEGERSSFELEYPCHSEEKRQWFILRAELCEFGAQALVLVSHYDISGRKLSEIQTQRFSQVVQEIPLGLMVLENLREEDRYRIEEFNPFGQALTGIKRDDALGNMLSDVFPQIRGTELFEGIEKVSRNKEVYEVSDYQAEDPAFEDKFWDIKAFPLSGNMIGVSFEDVTEEIQSRQKLKYIATHDEMTGLLERSFFLDRFSEEYERSERYDRDLSVVLLDLDDFKRINDEYGHLAGDQVLRRLGEILSETARESDLVGRYGGEEFCLVLPETSLEQARELAARIREAVEGQTFETDRGDDFDITTSAGITERTESDEEIREMIGRADRALYQAKDRGKNRVEEA